jgi:hypothetical protein
MRDQIRQSEVLSSSVEDSSDLTLSIVGPSGASAGQIRHTACCNCSAVGGMGEVWLAEQKAPIRRIVALKLIKTGMDTKAVVARFQSERQALALMDHPSIARVFDAGSTPEGRPYFVMEYVPGLPITEYRDKHRLTMKERLELFVQVCDGVQHAHRHANRTGRDLDSPRATCRKLRSAFSSLCSERHGGSNSGSGH